MPMTPEEIEWEARMEHRRLLMWAANVDAWIDYLTAEHPYPIGQEMQARARRVLADIWIMERSQR